MLNAERQLNLTSALSIDEPIDPRQARDCFRYAKLKMHCRCVRQGNSCALSIALLLLSYSRLESYTAGLGLWLTFYLRIGDYCFGSCAMTRHEHQQ